jgi:ribonuclease HI
MTTTEELPRAWIYCDGSCIGNPGPAAWAYVLDLPDTRGGRTVTAAGFMGDRTNNVAELAALRRGCYRLRRTFGTDFKVIVYSDSQYAINTVAGIWTPKKNLRLVEKARTEIERFPDLGIVWIKGHAKCEGNKRADRLAQHSARSRVHIRPTLRKGTVYISSRDSMLGDPKHLVRI